MTEETTAHLFAWIVRTCHEDERMVVAKRILSLLRDYPDLVDIRTWREIRELADRYAGA